MRAIALDGLTYKGRPFDTDRGAMGELRASTDIQDDPRALRMRMAEDGYLFLRGFSVATRSLPLGMRSFGGWTRPASSTEGTLCPRPSRRPIARTALFHSSPGKTRSWIG